MSRSDIPDVRDRRPFYLYVDEFQNFATDSFATILSEARKYGLNLTVANQYISQMSDTVRDAVFGNVGTMISFRVSADDAPILAKQFEPNSRQSTFYRCTIVISLSIWLLVARKLPRFLPAHWNFRQAKPTIHHTLLNIRVACIRETGKMSRRKLTPQ